MLGKIGTQTVLTFMLLIHLLAPTGIAANRVPGIKNFGKTAYGAASQNWGVAAGKDDLMYFANHNGLLEFDGTNWQLHRLPNETIIRAVFTENDSIIYTSGYREMGFWKRDNTGRLFYNSLNPKIQHLFSKNEEFWNITSLRNEIYFHSFNRLFIYKHDTIVPVDLPGFTNTMHRVGNQILIAVKDQGIFTIENDQPKLYISDPFFKDKTIRFLLPYKDNQLMIGTASHGIAVWDGQTIREWNPEWTAYFAENELNRAHLSKNGELILGTIVDGIMIFDRHGKFLSQVGVSTGLQNNTVLGIATDPFNNIWLALDSGIDFVSSAPPTGLVFETIPNIGAVYSAAIYQKKLYLGTNQGLFEKDLSDSTTTYRMLPGTQGQIWDCRVIGNQLLAGHNAGTFSVSNGEAIQISRNSGGFAIRQDAKNGDRLIQCTYSNLVTYTKENGKIGCSHLINGFYDLIRFVEIDHLGNIWASHMHRGIYQLQLDDEWENVIHQKYYGEGSVFGKDHSLHVFKVENRIVFTTEEKLFTYDDLNDTIIPYTLLNDRLGKNAACHRIIEAPNHHYWLISSESIVLCRITASKVEIIQSYPNTVFSNHALVDGFENIYPVSETRAILCLEDGIAWLDAAARDSVQTIRYHSPQLRELQLFDNRNEPTFLMPKNKYLKVDYGKNNIQLRCSFPHFTDAPIFYQAWLKGIDAEWSPKTESPVFRFDRLPAGTYELQVKAVDLWNNESQPYLLTLEILPPWYQTRLVRFGYLVLLVILILGVRALGIRQTQRKEQAEHEKREQELIRLRNEKLNAEIAHKSRELANSTMSILKKNEFLLDLKRIVAEQKEQLGSRYPDKYYLHLTDKIEQNISSHDDWQLFETNFEQAHEQFLKKIKDDYPDLTGKDLRLCAYLRMNLSSKEIAPLLGISVRGVENHRYRLRRKMGMEHDDTLIDLILKY
ncbi:helix-turn-helix and ligand-binding sensor domain-containing protein [Gaoshiqia sediminis]|uniref:Regulator n=1 Tax=Gaoshiqia sediminis TaxID=2986998 RepID=A0AA42C9B9_9BACT|nr:regulator [Gaoshiqia sediminis]MCW0483751.1 regulator [Gaoshiqia sediminis]